MLPKLSRYNRWANERLFGACADLDDGARRADQGAFFGSILNTLNHLLVVDRLFAGRLSGTDSGIKSLDEVPYDDFEELWAARRSEDARIVEFVAALSEEDFSRTIEYRRVDGTPKSSAIGEILITQFNHQTHHRGQVTCMLSQAGQAYPPLDIIVFPDN